jgi:N-acetylmuramidase
MSTTELEGVPAGRRAGGATQPTGPLAGLSAAERKALQITSSFETGRPLGFGGLTGNFDGQGLSFGLLQWNVGSGSLLPLFEEFAQRHPDRFDAVFGEQAGQLRDVLRRGRSDRAARMRWAVSINDARNRIVEPWRSSFGRLEADPAFQAIELRHVRRRFESAARYARRYGLRTERGFVLMFDIVTQQGPAGLDVYGRAARIRSGVERLGPNPSETAILEVIANVVADTSLPRWRENVRRRKLTIVRGVGVVHGSRRDLGQEFGLSNAPWQPSAGGAAPPPALPAPAAEATRLQDAIRGGLRDENRLTDILFQVRHPDLGGRRLGRGDTALVREWLQIRDGLVRPALARLAPTPPVPNATGPAPPPAPVDAAPAPMGVFFKDVPELRQAPLAPAAPIPVSRAWSYRRRVCAQVYNRLGGLMAPLARRTGIELPAVIAVWLTESGGEPHTPGRAILRFENHLLWDGWGKHNPALFDRHFRFGGRLGRPGRRWEGHQFRESPDGPFVDLHVAGRQDLEYRVLELARRLVGNDVALQCASIGGPQLLMSHYRTLGYASPGQMYAAWQRDERFHVLGFFDFCARKPAPAAGDLLRYLRSRQWPDFARYYNGTGQIPTYSAWLRERYEEASQLPLPR